jgi:hypothetical protein
LAVFIAPRLSERRLGTAASNPAAARAFKIRATVPGSIGWAPTTSVDVPSAFQLVL